MGELYGIYRSVFSWRYGSDEIREVWSERNKRRLWRILWVCLAETQADFGVVPRKLVDDLAAHVDDIDIERSLEIEREIHHDLMAELKVYSEQCEAGGGIIHLGATSVDIKDNTIAIQVRASLAVLKNKLQGLILQFISLAKTYVPVVTLGYTHLQPAEPVSLGYRFALYAQDLFEQYQALERIHEGFRGKGMRGAVGSGASYAELIGVKNYAKFDRKISERLGLPFYPLTHQTYPRLQEFELLSCFAAIAAAIHRFALDVRFLQTPSIGEWREPFRARQVGSSAMPHKKNPVTAEKIDSLARLLSQYPRVAWDNAANSMLERTLDDSANRRVILPEACLALDELLTSLDKIVRDLDVDREAIGRNVARYAPFMAIERILMAVAKKGADRQQMHEVLRGKAMAAWEAVQAGQANPLEDHLLSSPEIMSKLTPEAITDLMDVSGYLGNSIERAEQFISMVEDYFNEPKDRKGGDNG